MGVAELGSDTAPAGSQEYSYPIPPLPPEAEPSRVTSGDEQVIVRAGPASAVGSSPSSTISVIEAAVQPVATSTTNSV